MIQAISATQDIEWNESVPHSQLFPLIAKSHLFVMPTLDDTFGWAIAEAMSIGVPVISTNVCAVPEMVKHNVTGFQIKLPLQRNLRWKGLEHSQGSGERRQAVKEVYELVADRLAGMMQEFWEDTASWQVMSEAGIMHIRQQHDPRGQAAKLRSIYEECL